jgi:hypothetical protein
VSNIQRGLEVWFDPEAFDSMLCQVPAGCSKPAQLQIGTEQSPKLSIRQIVLAGEDWGESL